MDSSRAPICPKCRRSDKVKDKSHTHLAHGGHVIGKMAGSLPVTLIATFGLWAIGKVVDLNTHDWRCERCAHGFTQN